MYMKNMLTSSYTMERFCQGKKILDQHIWGFDVLDRALFNADISIHIEGVDAFTSKILFMTGEWEKIIGPEWQREQILFFSKTELAVIPDTGHEMLKENPKASNAMIRENPDAQVR